MYGTVTVGFGTNQQKELQIIDFVQTTFKDNRLISVSQLEDNSYVCTVENPISTGRNPQSTMLLSKESMIGLVSTILFYFNLKDENIEDLLAKSTTDDRVKYVSSDNL